MYHNPDMLSDSRSGILLFIGESFGHALVLVLGLSKHNGTVENMK